MFWNNPVFLENYYQTLYKFFNFKEAIKPLPVDFEKPWWQILTTQKWAFGLEVASEIVQSAFESVSPLIIGYAISQRSWTILLVFVLLYVGLEIINRIILRIYNIAVINATMGSRISAYKYFLTVDPIFHSTKSSGQILAKVDRATQNLSHMIFMFTGNILPVVSGFLTIVITIAFFNPVLGLVGVITLVLITGANSLLSFVNAQTFKKKSIESSDKAMSIVTESLIQNALIRSSFATNEQYVKIVDNITQEGIVRANSALTNGLATTLTRLLYISGVLALCVLVFDMIAKNQIESILAVTLIITYINGSRQVLNLGNTVRQFTEQLNNIADLFLFIRNFGQQTYPVLATDVTVNKVQTNSGISPVSPL